MPGGPERQATRVDPVLVIDDETVVLQSIQLILKHAGYESVGASSGSEAMVLLDGPTPLSVAIVDLVLPDISGEEILRRARELRPDLPLIAMSGYGRRLSRTKASVSADATISKPFDRRILLETIAALIGTSIPSRPD